MTILKLILILIFGALMIVAGIPHFTKPDFYNGFLFDFLPKKLVNYIGGVLEILIGVGMIIPQTRPVATSAFLLLMIAFLPLHIADVFKEHPAVGSAKIAQIRLPIQFVVIALAWFMNKK